MTFDLKENQFFGDYYICFNLKAEFVHIAQSFVEAFALSKTFLLKKIFPTYPEIYREIKDDSKYRYVSWMREGIIKHKQQHMTMINKKSTYNSINLGMKYSPSKAMHQILCQSDVKSDKIEDAIDMRK